MRFFRVVFLFLLSGFSSISGYSQSLTGEQLQWQDQFQIDPESTNGYVYGKAIDFDIDNETGKRVVVWEEREANGTTSGNRDIFFQIFDKDMDPITVALDAAETKLLDQYYVKVKINQQDNTFVIAWTSNHGGSNDIYAKKYNLENGNPITTSYLVNHQSTTLNFNEDKSQILPYLTFDYYRNELVVGWLDLDGRDGGVYAANTGSYAVRMNYSSFTTIGNEFQINGNGLNSTIQRLFGLEISPVTGDLLTICQSMGYPNAGNWDIVFRKFTRNSSGDFIGEPEFVVNDITTGTQDSPYLGINRTTGDYIITYTDSDGQGSGAFAQVYDKYGNSIGNKFRINVPKPENQRYPKAAWDELTNTIVFFYYYTYSSVANIKYQIYNDEVIPLGTETNALPSSVNLRYNWQEHFFQYDQKRKKVVLAYKEYQSNSSTANTKIFLRQMRYEHPSFTATTSDPDIISTPDITMNWTNVREFDENGNVIGESRQYFDNLGRPLQTNERNIAENKVIVASTLYDKLGRAAIQTLPAALNTTVLGYRSGFVRVKIDNAYQTYSTDDFDAETGEGSINNPRPVGTNQYLGRYYSNSNNLDPFVGATGYPYSRIDYNDKAGGKYIRTTLPGDQHRMGSGKERASITVSSIGELEHYIALRHYFVSGVTARTLTKRAVKTISIDENGIETVTFSDREGKVLATAMSGMKDGQNTNVINYKSNGLFASNSGTLFGSTGDPSSPQYIEVYDQLKQELLFVGTVLGFNSVSLGFPNNIWVTSPHAISFDHQGVVTNSIFTNYVPVTTYLDIHIPDGMKSQFDLDGSYTILDLVTGTTTTLSAINSESGSGFYRISNTNPAAEVGIKNPQNYYDFTYYYYDDAGRLVATVAPKGVVLNSTAMPGYTTTYKYTSLNWLISLESPDEGKTEYVYRKDGKLRFSQNKQQSTPPPLGASPTTRMSYISYDDYGRVISSGVYTIGEFSYKFENQQTCATSTNTYGIHTILEETGELGGLQDGSRCSEVSSIYYDEPQTGSSRTQRFLLGSVSKTLNKANYNDLTPISETWFSYDEYNNLEWTVQNINGLGARTVDYAYDLRGNVQTVIYQKAVTADRFEHRYVYDADKRLKRVLTRKGTGSLVEQAEYKYYLHGPLKRTELGGNLQGVDYMYTIQGWLKSINHPDLNNSAADPGKDGTSSNTQNPNNLDLFGLNLDYFHNDFVRSGSYVSTTGSGLTGEQQFNGNIRSYSFNSRRNSVAAIPQQYDLSYDKKYQLSSAVYGTHNYNLYSTTFSPDPNNGLKEFDILYDKNGNITQLKRTDVAGTVINKQQYGISNINNQLNFVKIPWVFTGYGYTGEYYPVRNFLYNKIGQLIKETNDYQRPEYPAHCSQTIAYNNNGNVTGIYSGCDYSVPVALFEYDERGSCIKKTIYNNGVPVTTYCIYDIGGNLIGTESTENSVTTKEVMVYGMSRIGVGQYTSSSVVYNYELKDHLGNVRVVFKKSSTGGAEIVSSMDYYPFGSLLPSAVHSSPQHKFGYQGEWAESMSQMNSTGGYNFFDLRMYDPNLGRWFAPDPQHQFHSPYLAMGNNPVSSVDPDGGWVVMLNFGMSAVYQIKGGVNFSLALDETGNLSLLFTPSLGVGVGVGSSAGFSITAYPVSGVTAGDLTGFGFNVGGFGDFFGGYSVEANVAIGNNTANAGLTFSHDILGIKKVNLGNAAYADVSYTHNLADNARDVYGYLSSNFNMDEAVISSMVEQVAQAAAKMGLQTIGANVVRLPRFR